MSTAWSDVEHLDVLVIRAGLSGIDAGLELSNPSAMMSQTRRKTSA
jgi:hypothetical protein